MRHCIFLLFVGWIGTMSGQSPPAHDFSFLMTPSEPLAMLTSVDIDARDDELLTLPLQTHETFGCELVVFLTEVPIPPASYEAGQQIIATGVVQSGTVSMRAGVEVLLENNFEVQIGATLEVTMGPCTF